MKSKFRVRLWLALLLLLTFVPALTQPGYSSYHKENPQTQVDNSPQVLTGGYYHSCLLTIDGKVRCWGGNFSGQLGDGTEGGFRARAMDVIGLAGKAISISAGRNHTCALLEDSRVQCWGDNEAGQLGDGSNINRTIPVFVSGLTSGVTALSAGDSHTCVVVDASVKCWGSNFFQQLGDGTFVSRNVPVQVQGLGEPIIAITAGGSHTCALTSNGRALCWGADGFGQLGDGIFANTKGSPVQPFGLSQGVKALEAGWQHTCALMEDERVKCWGVAKIPLAPSYISRLPTDVDGLNEVTSLVAGEQHTCALKHDGGVTCWGDNFYSQLGIGFDLEFNLVEVPELEEGAANLGVGFNHTCAIMRTGGIKCWGINTGGLLANDLPYHGFPVDALVHSCTVPLAVNKYCGQFLDNFDNPNSRWPILDNSTATAEYLDGEYRVLVKKSGNILAVLDPTCGRKYYKVEAQMRWAGNSGTAYGIIFGVKGNFEQFYAFLVNSDYQEFSVYRYDYDVGWTALRIWYKTIHINQGKAINRLKIVKEDRAFGLYLNDAYHFSISDSYLPAAGETMAGLIVMSYLDLDNADARFLEYFIDYHIPNGFPWTLSSEAGAQWFREPGRANFLIDNGPFLSSDREDISR